MLSRFYSSNCVSCNQESSIYCYNCIQSLKRWSVPSYILSGVLLFASVLFLFPVSGYEPFYLTSLSLGTAGLISIPQVRYWIATHTVARVTRGMFVFTLIILLIGAFVFVPV